jgi:protein SCO1/2
MSITSKAPKSQRPDQRIVYAVLGVLVAVILVGTGVVLWMGNGRSGAFSLGGPFVLQDDNGRTVTDQSFRGKYMLVYFGYTFCPDVCPTTLNAVADAMDKLGGKADRVQPLFITVDPKRDTAPVMKQYVAAFGSRIEGLTGTPDQISQVAKEYKVYYAEHRTGPGPNDYSMDHSSVLYLMGPDGQFIAPLRADESGDQMAARLAQLIS